MTPRPPRSTLFPYTTLFRSERASRTPAREATRIARTRSSVLAADRRNAETTAAMGMEAALSRRWLALNAGYLAAIERSSDVIGFYSSLSRITRMMLQSAALGQIGRASCRER